jgi:hypothetical protein
MDRIIEAPKDKEGDYFISPVINRACYRERIADENETLSRRTCPENLLMDVVNTRTLIPSLSMTFPKADHKVRMPKS